MAREIAAVDGRDVFRLHRAQILGGVPVEEVAAEALQLVQRRECRLQPLDGLERAAPAEIARRDAREQIEPDVRRRGAPRDDGLRAFLEIVGREEIVRRRHEALEEAPCAPRDQAQAARVRRAQRELAVLARRQARQPRDERRERPQREQRRRHRPDARPHESQHHADSDREDGARDDLGDERAAIEIGRVARLRRRHPFEQAPAGDQAEERAKHRVDHQPGLVREEGDQERALQHAELEIVRQRAEMASQRAVGLGRQQAREGRQQGWKRDGEQDRQRPDLGGAARHEPADEQREHGRRRGERTAKIVEQLPPAHQRQLGAAGVLVRGLAEAEYPRQQLPVAARPAVLARRRHVITRREFLDHLDVGGQSGAREYPFQQVVAKDRVLGDLAVQRRLERIDVVDAFADERAFVKQVLIDVADRERIRIEAVGSGEDALIERALAADGKRRRDARLKHRMSVRDHAARGIEDRAVQRMRHLADEAARRADGHARVRIERDDVADALRQGRLTFDGQERRVRGTTQQPVHLMQLAALALPADPFALAFVPHAPAVQKIEARRAASGPDSAR